MRPSIRVRLVAAFALTLALVLLGVGTLVLLRFRTERDQAIDAELRDRADALEVALRRAAPGDLVALLGTSDERFGQVLDGAGRVVAASRSLREGALVDTTQVGRRTTTVTTREERRHVRVLVARSGSRTLVLATALDDRDDSIRNLAALLWIGGGVTLVVASLLAGVVTGAALRPVERLRAQAATYSTSDLSGRLAVPATDDELRRLAETLNGMLGRIQGRFEEQRTFVDNASHELRTPLANLTMELELALRHERTAPELRAALESASQETDRLNRLASDLLLLSRASGDVPLTRRPTDLLELVHETTATFRARAEAGGITLVEALDPVEVVQVDPTSIRQALTNLLDNAVRATPSGGTVTVALTRASTEVRLSVGDTGPGFPPDLRPRAFDLFARGSPGGRSGSGSGLGLGIVAAVARAHGGRATIQDDAPGAVVTITLPLVGGL